MRGLSDIELREAFHLTFLARLLRLTGPGLFVLKGGVNLRFFLKSPRYSEDMDLDAVAGAPATLSKNVYKVLGDASFLRALRAYGIAALRINDVSRAKQTETTQRFRLRLVKGGGEELPTKVEFSRRPGMLASVYETIDIDVAARYQTLAFACQHYPGPAAAHQKVAALAGRAVTQARDAFDLYLLHVGGHLPPQPVWRAERTLISKARDRVASITFRQYRDQVGAYLARDAQESFATQTAWTTMQQLLLRLLTAP